MIAPNTILQNRYLVLNQIGQGGMGAVYVATDQRFGSTVALKETFFTDPGLRKAFEREARLLNHLRHPALPRVSDHFIEEEGQFLVMEYIAGDDLAEKLKERGGAFPLSEVLNWADQLLDALDYLHTQEPPVIHRDIKPQNLKLTPRNHIVLLDFGLAKGTLAQTKVTATGSVFGYSRNYAPLEQIQGAGTDLRSDIYSLGATLYHLMTGVTPPDALTRATAVLNGQPDPLRPANEIHPQVSTAVAEVISKAMAQNAGQRPQTASSMREALREAARSTHTIARDTNALPTPSTNLYEQETQLIYGAAPATKTEDAVNKTGETKATADGATVAEAAVAASNKASSTKAGEPQSVVTKVASGRATELKSRERKRTYAIAASAIVLVALAAVVYTFTRNATPTPSNNQSVQTASPTPSAENVNTQNAPAEVKTEASPTPAQQIVIIRGPEGHDKSSKGKGQEEPKIEVEPPDVEVPEPPEPNDTPLPRRPRRFPPPGTPEFEEAVREAAEERRQSEEVRRAAQEQRRQILIRQREILERERKRRLEMRRQRQQP